MRYCQTSPIVQCDMRGIRLIELIKDMLDGFFVDYAAVWQYPRLILRKDPFTFISNEKVIRF